MDGIDVLIEYFNIFKKCEENSENDKTFLKEIDKILNILKETKDRSNKAQYLIDFSLIEKIVEKYDVNLVIKDYVKEKYGVELVDDIKNNDNLPSIVKEIILNVSKGMDVIMYDIMLNLNRYNLYLMNKKVRSQDLPITADINFENLDVKLKDVLNYLEVGDGDLDEYLLSDLSKNVDLNKFKELATMIKTDNGMKRVLFDKIEDKNVLVSILLHSNIDLINSIINIFESEHANINKVVSNIPSIFIKDLKFSKCKYNVILLNYDNFINNYKLIKDNNIDFKKMLNFSAFFVNDCNVNKSLVEKLNSLGVLPKNVLEYVGGIFVTNPNLIFNNINVLKDYGIKLTNDKNNNGYTLLGMKDLADRLDYLIEKRLWDKNEVLSLDTIDLIRGLIIKDDYNEYLICKEKGFYGKIDDASTKEDNFLHENFSEERINKVYEEHNSIKNIINKLDSDYLTNDGIYSIGINVISKQRILRNLCNYRGKGNDYEMFESVLRKNSNIDNLDEVINHIMPLLEMGEESVKLSQRI